MENKIVIHNIIKDDNIIVSIRKANIINMQRFLNSKEDISNYINKLDIWKTESDILISSKEKIRLTSI